MSPARSPGGPRIAVYPGSFDPLHEGHLDIIRRCRPRGRCVPFAVDNRHAPARPGHPNPLGKRPFRMRQGPE